MPQAGAGPPASATLLSDIPTLSPIKKLPVKRSISPINAKLRCSQVPRDTFLTGGVGSCCAAKKAPSHPQERSSRARDVLGLPAWPLGLASHHLLFFINAARSPSQSPSAQACGSLALDTPEVPPGIAASICTPTPTPLPQACFSCPFLGLPDYAPAHLWFPPPGLQGSSQTCSQPLETAL